MRQSRIFSQVRKLTDFTDLKITRISAYQVDLPLHEGEDHKKLYNASNSKVALVMLFDRFPFLQILGYSFEQLHEIRDLNNKNLT